LGIAVILAQACDRITRALARWAVSYPFPVLCDADRAVAKRYGVWHPIGLDAFNTAHPASFLIDAERRIRYAFVGSSQFARAPLDRILDVARAAPASPQG
jgi:peroxiredoxin